jgi:hypothetical protein
LLVSSAAMISPVSASTPIWSFRQDRCTFAACFSTSHSPGPHMWTAPGLQGLCSCDGLVGCGHMSGLCCAVGLTAGPDGLRGSGSKQSSDVLAPTGPTGCPDPRIDRLPSCCRCPCSLQWCQVSVAGGLKSPVDAGTPRRSPSWPR